MFGAWSDDDGDSGAWPGDNDGDDVGCGQMMVMGRGQVIMM